MNKKKQINIMGVNWTINWSDEKIYGELSGATDWTNRSIYIATWESKSANKLNDINEVIKKTVRHELIHAYLFECGLCDDCGHIANGHDEQYIDWMATIYPRYKKSCEELEV